MDRPAGGGEVFCEPEWFELLERTTLPAHERVKWHVVPGSEAAVRLPTVPRRGRGGCRELHGLQNYYSSLFGPVCGPEGPDPEDVAGLAEVVARASPAWDVIRFQPLERDGGFARGMEAALARHGYRVERFFCFGNWYQETSDGFGAYFAGRPSRVRNTVQRAGRKLARQPGFSLTIHTERGAALEAAIGAYQTVYARSWKQPEPHAQFIPELCRLAARKGWLRLGVVEIGSEPAAAQIWLVHGGKASIFKLAYDERFAATSVGSVLTAALMEHVIDRDRVREVDYLTGDDAYKRDWMDSRRERWGLVAFSRRTPLGLLAAAEHYGRRALRRFLPEKP